MATGTSGRLSGSSTNSSTGLGQGIDVTQFVQLAMSFDQANITAVQNQQSNLANQSKALAQISSELSALQDSAYALGDPLGALNALTASSSDTSIVSATAGSAAVSGSHSITVNSLATTSSYYTSAVASSSTPLATGSFQFAVGSGGPQTVTITSSNNTLDGLAASINKLSAGVRASVINDANGARLALVSETSGAPGDVTVSNNSSGLTFTKAVTGLNASLVVDGVPVSSSTNTVSGVINGVTLSLGSPNPNQTVTVNVAPDNTQATNAINQFVSNYNTAIKDINAQFAVPGDGTAPPLESDGSLREAQQLLLGAIAYSTSGNSGIVNLSSIGVNLNNDGTLSVNSAQLQTALSSNNSAVQSFLQNTGTGFGQNLSTVLTNINSPGSGILGLDANGITNTSQSLAQQLTDLQVAFNTKQANLILVYSQVNATLQELPLLQSQTQQQLAGA